MTQKIDPQQQAKLDAIKKNWAQKKRISEHLNRIKFKLGIYSGKGGVGKTTVAVNTAVTLARQGCSVGILDADIDCPNIVKAMNVTDKPRFQEGTFVPTEKYGVKILSSGFFQKSESEAIIMRGPMIHNALTQFLESTDWGDLDYLVVDLPPGTSDAALTIMQTLPMDGFVIVTTPQELAKMDAQRSINMIKKLNVKVLGVVENFTGDIFGTGAGKDLASEEKIPFLGHLQLRPEYQDLSQPTSLSSSIVSQEYETVIQNFRPDLEASRPK